MIIDAKDLILGRLGTTVAKKALQGFEVNIINAEKAVVAGDKKTIQAKYKRIREMGAPMVGPYLQRTPEKFVKRTIRGMLPYKQSKGAQALKRIKCYKGVPAEFQGQEAITIKEANIEKVTAVKFQTVEQICKFLGGK
jgi:large subunit ribosomal protein L13